jgi:hypothetical protein
MGAPQNRSGRGGRILCQVSDSLYFRTLLIEVVRFLLFVTVSVRAVIAQSIEQARLWAG